MEKSNTIISRIAPTPSGYLHTGNVFNFVLIWLKVRSANGLLHLRIDDLDRQRIKSSYLSNIFQVLEWLKLNYDFGPSGVSDFQRNHSQAHKIHRYIQALNQVQENAHCFHCKCSRKEISLHSQDGQYPGTCKPLKLKNESGNTCLRIDTSDALKISFREKNTDSQSSDLNAIMKDFIVWRKDDIPAYQLASVVDDIEMNINYIIRGSDLLPSSYAQTYLAQFLPNNEFSSIVFEHHPLLIGTASEKLSKSTNSESVMSEYNSAAKVCQAFARWQGLNPKASSLKELLEDYKLK